jgi:hypothetical protein
MAKKTMTVYDLATGEVPAGPRAAAAASRALRPEAHEVS